MKVMFDANILLDVFQNRQPYYRDSAFCISEALTVTRKKPWRHYASTRRPGVRSPVIHSSASSNTRWGADCTPCQSVGPRNRNPRRGKGVNRWLSPISPFRIWLFRLKRISRRSPTAGLGQDR